MTTKKPPTKDPCAKFQMQAAAAAGAGAIIGAFTFGIGTLAGGVAAAALTKKGNECRAKNAALAQKQQQALELAESRKTTSSLPVPHPVQSATQTATAPSGPKSISNIQIGPSTKQVAMAVGIVVIVYLAYAKLK